MLLTRRSLLVSLLATPVAALLPTPASAAPIMTFDLAGTPETPIWLDKKFTGFKAISGESFTMVGHWMGRRSDQTLFHATCVVELREMLDAEDLGVFLDSRIKVAEALLDSFKKCPCKLYRPCSLHAVVETEHFNGWADNLEGTARQDIQLCA